MSEQDVRLIHTTDGATLAAVQAGEGTPVVLAHGLTATRRYVLMGSRLLERSGHRVIAYDARGHGSSSPAPISDAYTYPRLAADLADLLDQLDVGRAVVAGVSMGAHTALALTLTRPQSVGALVLITPAFDPLTHQQAEDDSAYAGWDALAAGLRQGGIEGFLAAYDLGAVPERWRETVRKVIEQRLAAHEHPDAVADALEVVPRSAPFDSIEQLGAIDVPTIVIASQDEADPGHPRTVAETYARTIPQARLMIEERGRSPLAWQGGAISRLIAELAKTAI